MLASRSAVTGAVKLLEGYRMARRTRAAGERVDRVGLDPTSRQPQNFDPRSIRSTPHCSVRDWPCSPTHLRSGAPRWRRWSRWPSSSVSGCPRSWTNGTPIAINSGRAESCPHLEVVRHDRFRAGALRERAESGDTDAVDELVQLAAELGDLKELRRLAEGAVRTPSMSSFNSRRTG